MRRDVDRAVGAVAARQHGAFSAAQAAAAGASGQLRRRRIAAGLWIPHPGGACSLQGSPASWLQGLWLAVLGFRAGDAAVARRAAAAMLGCDGFAPGRIEVVVPRGRAQPRPYDVHEARRLDPVDVVQVGGLPVTSPARTLIALAAHVVRAERLERIVDAELAAGRVRLDDLAARFAALATPGRSGVGLLRPILAERLPGYVPPSSALEALFIDVVRRADLDPPVRQGPLPSLTGAGRTDFTFVPERHIVEVDGRRWHDRRLTRRADAWRDNEATALGWTIQRFEHIDLVTEPQRVVDVLRRRLALGPPQRL